MGGPRGVQLVEDRFGRRMDLIESHSEGEAELSQHTVT